MYTYETKYTDWLGNERNEKFLFNMTEAELAEMHLSINGGMDNVIKKIIETKDNARLIKIFKDLVLQSYGEISSDGRRFQKSDELSKAFSETPVYSELFMLLATNADKAAEFLNGIMPEKIRKQAGPIDIKAAEEQLKLPQQSSLLSDVPAQNYSLPTT